MSRDAAQDQARSIGPHRHTADLGPDTQQGSFSNLEFWPLEADYHAEETDTMQWLRQLDEAEPMTHEELQGTIASSQPWHSSQAEQRFSTLHTQHDPDHSFVRVSDAEVRMKLQQCQSRHRAVAISWCRS